MRQRCLEAVDPLVFIEVVKVQESTRLGTNRIPTSSIPLKCLPVVGWTADIG